MLKMLKLFQEISNSNGIKCYLNTTPVEVIRNSTMCASIENGEIEYTNFSSCGAVVKQCAFTYSFNSNQKNSEDELYGIISNIEESIEKIQQKKLDKLTIINVYNSSVTQPGINTAGNKVYQLKFMVNYHVA